MGSITNSEVVKVSQRNGHRRIWERHTDHTGAVHERSYVTYDPTLIPADQLTPNAAKVLNILKERELTAKLNKVWDGQTVQQAELEFITMGTFRSALNAQSSEFDDKATKAAAAKTKKDELLV